MTEVGGILTGLIYSDKLSENFKSINKAIKDLNYSSDEIKAYICNVKPKSVLEKIILVKLIDRFHLHNEFIVALMSEDVTIIRLLMKCTWFFSDVQDLLSDPSKFIDEIFVNVSLVTQHKLLKMYGRYLRNKQKADKLFQSVADTYGEKRALNLLPACSVCFIKKVLYKKRKNKFITVLSSELLYQLYLYHKDFFLDYFSDFIAENKFKPTGIYRYHKWTDPVLIKLLTNHPKQFIDLYNKFSDHITISKIGKNLTKKLLDADYSAIVSNAEKYSYIFHGKVLASCLNFTQIEEYSLKLMPQTMDEFLFSGWLRHLELYKQIPVKVAGDILLKNFLSKYGKSILVVDDVPEELVHLFPEEERVAWAKKHLDDPKLPEEKRIQYAGSLCFADAMPALRKHLPTAVSSETREALVKAMIRSATFSSNAVEKLCEVITLVNQKFRNDRANIKCLPLQEASNRKLSCLSVEQWSPIIELINNLRANNELNYCNREVVTLYQKWILKRLDESLPSENEIKTLLQLQILDYQISFDFTKKSPHARFILQCFSQELGQLQEAYKKHYNWPSLVISLFVTLSKWNYNNPNETVPIGKWMVDTIKDYVKENCYNRTDIVDGLSYNPEVKKIICDELFVDLGSPPILLYKLKYSPRDLLEKKVEVFTRIIFSDASLYRKFFQKVAYYPTVPIAQALVDLSIEALKLDETTTEKKQSCLIVISYLADNLQILSTMKPYLPNSSLAMMDTPENIEAYQLRRTIATQLNFMNPHSDAIPYAIEFCKGDYLKMIIDTFASIMVHIPQVKALDLLASKMDSPVSFKKHILRLLGIISPIKVACETLYSALVLERNVSVRAVLLESLYNLLKQEENEYVWSTVKKTLAQLNKDDIKQVSVIFNLDPIPEEFLMVYVESMWATLERLKTTKDYTQKIFELVNEESICVFSESFCDILFGVCFECDDVKEILSPNHRSFISLYLFRKSSDIAVDARVSKVMTCLKKIILSNWDKVDEKSNKLIVQESFSLLVSEICKASLEERAESPAAALLGFQKACILILSEEEGVTDHFVLDLYIAYHKVRQGLKKTDFDVVASEVFPIIDKYIDTYGLQYLSVLIPFLKNFIEFHFDEKSEKYSCSSPSLYKFVERILSSEVSMKNKILGIDLMASFYDMDEGYKSKYKALLSMIRSLDDKPLKLYAKYKILKK